jgi:RNA polymerase-binding transcription factor DksA
LEAREREILSRIQNIDSDKKRSTGPLNADSEEQVVELQNNEVMDGLDDITRQELDDIRAALAKIEDGSYGICASCNEPIPEKRLEALPYATRCVRCEEEHEQSEF